MGNATTALLNATAHNHVLTEQGSHTELGTIQSIVKITGSSSYATGGDTVDLSGSFATSIILCLIFPNGSKFLPVYAAGSGPTNGKIKLVDSTSGSEVANTTDVHLQTFFAIVRGT